MGAVIFLRHEIYKKSVSSVEAEIGMEGQIMCIECTFYMSLVAFLGPQNATDPTGIATLRPVLLRGVEGRGGEGRGGAKMIYAPGRQKSSRCDCSSEVG